MIPYEASLRQHIVQVPCVFGSVELVLVWNHISINWKIIKNIIPGIPKNPAIRAVIAFIGITNPINVPIKFVIYNNTMPTIPFIRILIGHFNNLITKYNKPSPIKAKIIISILMTPPLYYNFMPLNKLYHLIYYPSIVLLKRFSLARLIKYSNFFLAASSLYIAASISLGSLT